MQALKIGADCSVNVVELQEPLHISAGKIVGGWIEHVRPKYLKQPLCMICNETGLINHLPINPIASLLYGFQDHGSPIAGDVLILKEKGEEWEGLKDDEIIVIGMHILALTKEWKEMNNGQQK